MNSYLEEPPTTSQPKYPNSTDYTATWTDTIQFTIKTDQEIPEFPTQNDLLLTILTITVILIHNNRKDKNLKKFFTAQPN